MNLNRTYFKDEFGQVKLVSEEPTLVCQFSSKKSAILKLFTKDVRNKQEIILGVRNWKQKTDSFHD